MKIMITGASGFLGQSVIHSLKNYDQTFQAYYVIHNNKFYVDDKRFTPIKCNLLNINQIKSLIETVRPSHLIHLAWSVTPGNFWNNEENFDWMWASIKLFQHFCDSKGKVFVGAGTIAEYDWSDAVLDETATQLKPKTIYGQAKKSLYESILSIRNNKDTKTKIIWPRIGYFFGENEPKDKLISKLIFNIRNDIPLDLAAPDFSRAYSHVNYFGMLVSQIIFKNKINDLSFNMSSTKLYALREIVEMLKKELRKPFSQVNYNAYLSEPTILSIKADALKKKMNFEIPDTFFEDLKNIVSLSK